MIADSNFKAIEDRIRQIIYTRVLFSRMFPDKPIPQFEAMTSGINGVSLNGLTISKDSIQLLIFLMREVTMYPGDVTVTFQNMTPAERENAEKWFVGNYDQHDNARQKVIMFSHLVEGTP